MAEDEVRQYAERVEDRIVELDARSSSDYAMVKAELEAVAKEVAATPLPDDIRAALKFSLSSVLINAADGARDRDGLTLGTQWAQDLAHDDTTPIYLVPQARYNEANGILGLFSLAENRSAGTSEGVLPIADLSYRLRKPHKLSAARVCLREVAEHPVTDLRTRSMAWCNLANVLDDSGRWVEAYAAYLDALQADPTNGNAAGNIAYLLHRRLSQPIGLRGHMAAVYNHYVKLAKSLRARTVQTAGESAAQLWDQLELMETEGHFAHNGDELDDYQQWIVRHRLALTPTVEGLGSDSDRWDSATVAGVAADPREPGVPRVFVALNVLKAEYLVARRLAFRGMMMIDESAPLQHEEDTGIYSATGDGGFYGEGPATLILAQRCALDVLDKIAVAANEHFQSGINPESVGFARYWLEGKQTRPVLSDGNPGNRYVLALAELAMDVFGKGMHEAANLLRNAGTHRLVHVTYGLPTGPTRDAFSSVDVDDLKSATISALWVTRAAYLYFVDLLDSQAPTTRIPGLVVPNQL